MQLHIPEAFLPEFGQFYLHQTPHTLLIARFSAEIDEKQASIGVRGIVRFDAIHQAVALAHAHVEARVHIVAAQHVVEHEQTKSLGVVGRICLVAHHHIGSGGGFVEFFVKGLVLEFAEPLHGLLEVGVGF